MVPIDTIKELEKQRDMKMDIEQKPSGKVDWDAQIAKVCIRAKVKKGIRNAIPGVCKSPIRCTAINS